MYPARSVAWGWQPFSLWYYSTRGSAPTQVCAGEGGGLIIDLQKFLRERLQSRPANDGSGVPIPYTKIPQDGQGGWSDAVLEGLWAVGNQDRVPRAYLDNLIADLRDKRISRETLQMAIWWAWEQGHTQTEAEVARGASSAILTQGGLRLPLVVLPNDILLPPYGVTLPRQATDRAGHDRVCHTIEHWQAEQNTNSVVHPGVIAGVLLLVIGAGAAVVRRMAAPKSRSKK
jgi:hypothetical protein